MSEARTRKAHVWDRHPDCYYVEPSWCDERLFAVERFSGRIVDPACGLGRIVAAAKAAGFDASGFDIKVRSEHCTIPQDFLDPGWFGGGRPVDNIVSNPPFGVAEAFAQRALERAQRKVALLFAHEMGAGRQAIPLARDDAIAAGAIHRAAAIHAARAGDRGRHQARRRHGRLLLDDLAARL